MTIVVEDEIEDCLIEDIKRPGAKGYTVTKVKGEGIHSARVTEWEGENIKISILTNEAVASSILQNTIFTSTAYVHTAEVLRGEKCN